ncbi:MAG TPA: hypothetical protein VD971_00565 [Phycisphaerales bacterium]|nr:hypothetical protein [Phycisphaerales bacterium]
MNPAAKIFAPFALASCLLLGGCEEKVTPETYAQLKTGMAQHEVEAILGGPGEKQDVGGMSISAAGIAGGAGANSQLTYVWKEKGREVSVTFADGKVVNVGKSGF